MRKALFALLLIVLALTAPQGAATGSISQTLPVQSFSADGRTVRFYDMVITTDASAGTVGEIAVSVEAGAIHQVEFYPDGTVPPDNLCDLTLLNAGSLDVLGGMGANIVVANKTAWMNDPKFYHPGGNLYPTLANGDNSKKFRLRFFVVA